MSRWINWVAVVAAGVTFAAPAFAVTSYRECVAAVEADPVTGVDAAMAWRDGGGGAPARHCVALALLSLGQEEEAALRFEQLALDADVGGPRQRAQILHQAGSAWLLATRPDEAETVLSSAIELDPGDADLYVSRALAKRMRGEWAAVINDLDGALRRDATNVDALVLRGVALRETGDYDRARRDIDRALELDPANVEARVEHGRLAEIAAGRGPDGQPLSSD